MMQTIQTLDYAAIAIYMMLVAGIGVFLGWFVKNISDYFKGGNSIPWYVGGISNFMSMFSTFIFVAYAGIAYEHGLIAVIIIWSTVPATLFATIFLAKRWRRAGIITPVEFMEARFNAPVRQIFSWGGVTFRILDNMVRLYAIGLFIAAATPLGLDVSIIAAGCIVVLYTVVGGLWAVMVTDTIQFVILICTTIILLPLSLRAVGGFDVLTATIPEHFHFFNGPKGAPLYLIAYFIMVGIKYNGNWSFIQRFYSMKDEKAAIKMGMLTTTLFLIFPIFFLIPPIAAKVLLPGLPDSEMAYVGVALEVLPPGIMGLLLAAMFAATMSSLDSEYNVVAGVVTKDIYQRLFNPEASEKQLMWVARITTFAVGSLVIVGAFYIGVFGGAFEANKLFTSLFAIPLVIPIIFGILLKAPRAWGAVASLVLGVGCGLFLNAHPEISWAVSTLAGIGVSAGVFILSGFVGKKSVHYPEKEAFFKKLNTPLQAGEIPVSDPVFFRALRVLFAVALGATGILFAGMSLPSIHDLSGQLTCGAGVVCVMFGLVLLYFSKKMNKNIPDVVNKKLERISYMKF